MRIAPIALFYDTSEADAMFDAVMAASLMTHRDCRSLAGAMAVVHAIRLLDDGAPKTASFLFRLAAAVARAEDRIASKFADEVQSLPEHGHSLSRAIAHVESVLDVPRERALAALVDEANRHGAEPACQLATKGFPPACIPTCLYLLLTTDSFEEAIIEVINLGGDADTTGAILGAMAGAHYGLDAIPTRWLTGLHNRAGVELRAMALTQGSTQDLDIPELIETERRLSELEGACRDQLLVQRQSGGDLGANRRI